jgi:hypothetical protein
VVDAVDLAVAATVAVPLLEIAMTPLVTAAFPLSAAPNPSPVVHHDEEEMPNALQRWNGSSVTPFMRWAYAVRDARGNARPSYNYDPDMNNAIFLSETIVSIFPFHLHLHLHILSLTRTNSTQTRS